MEHQLLECFQRSPLASDRRSISVAAAAKIEEEYDTYNPACNVNERSI